MSSVNEATAARLRAELALSRTHYDFRAEIHALARIADGQRSSFQGHEKVSAANACSWLAGVVRGVYYAANAEHSFVPLSLEDAEAIIDRIKQGDFL